MQFVWDLDPIIVHFTGQLALRYYGLLFAMVFIGGFWLFRWQVLRGGGSEDDAYAIVIPGAIGCVIGARLGHVFFYEFGHFLDDPLWVFRIWQGGLASHGAVVGLVLAAWYVAWKLGQSFAEVSDRFIFSVALGAILVRLGNLFNSEIVGKVTDQTWGVRFPRYDQMPPELAPLRHPSQLYEVALGLFVLGLLLYFDRRLGKEKRPRGAMAAIFLATYFTGRFFVEFFKERQGLPDSMSLSLGQILSIPVVLGGVYWLIRVLRHGVPSHWVVKPEEKEKVKAGTKESKAKKKKKR